jgi:hypothetical protein
MYRALFFLGAASTSAQRCERYGEFEGSEDVSLWRDGIAFVSSGMKPSPTQGGLMLAADLSGDEVKLSKMELRDIPDDGFRPHGIYIDNSTQRVFAISHSDLLEEESIYVFSIVDEGSDIPVLQFDFNLVSESFLWYPEQNIWFLNDLATVGDSDLLVTQYGPQGVPDSDKYLYQCSWDESNIQPDGRLSADCAIAYERETSSGLNGMNVNADRTKVWVNDLARSRLWEFDRNTTTGVLTRGPTINLPGIIDNLEYDISSGDITMGMIFELSLIGNDGRGGNIAMRGIGGPSTQIGVALKDDSPIDGFSDLYQVSSAIEYGKWTVLGSPWDTGLVVCDTEATF